MAFFIYWIIRVSNFANTKALQNLHTWGASEAAPHTWRIHLVNALINLTVRIISTYVENTPALSSVHLENANHLHIRGEYTSGFKWVDLKTGSSPHTWRILTPDEDSMRNQRIISTYVENTKRIL